jgi:hypothetical protein
MADARSLKHIRYVVAGKTPEDAMLPNCVHYWTTPEQAGQRGGTWTEELGAATIFKDYADARDYLNVMKSQYGDLVEKNNIKVQIIPAKKAMMAKLQYEGEEK